MTARQVFEYALVELNKVQAPSLLLEDYNYFINKAVNQYINKIYNAYEVNQQKSDDLRVLKGTTILSCYVQNDYGTIINGISNNPLFGATYETYLPDDYLHILNCIAEFKVKKNFKCYNANDIMHFGVKKLTSDMFSQIINNYYMRPSYKNPYFFINNVNTSNIFPTSDNQIPLSTSNKKGTISFNATPINNQTITVNGVVVTFKTTLTGTANEVQIFTGTDADEVNASRLYTLLINSSNSDLAKLKYNQDSSSVNITGDVNLAIATTITGVTLSFITITDNLTEKTPELRYGNKSKVRMEIRYGKDNKLFELQRVYVDYLKAPQFIRLTQSEVDEVEDNSQLIEFPDYVCQEIVNELTKLLMENGSDTRLQTNIPINQSIAAPQQEQPKR